MSNNNNNNDGQIETLHKTKRLILREISKRQVQANDNHVTANVTDLLTQLKIVDQKLKASEKDSSRQSGKAARPSELSAEATVNRLKQLRVIINKAANHGDTDTYDAAVKEFLRLKHAPSVVQPDYGLPGRPTDNRTIPSVNYPGHDQAYELQRNFSGTNPNTDVREKFGDKLEHGIYTGMGAGRPGQSPYHDPVIDWIRNNVSRTGKNSQAFLYKVEELRKQGMEDEDLLAYIQDPKHFKDLQEQSAAAGGIGSFIASKIPGVRVLSGVLDGIDLADQFGQDYQSRTKKGESALSAGLGAAGDIGKAFVAPITDLPQKLADPNLSFLGKLSAAANAGIAEKNIADLSTGGVHFIKGLFDGHGQKLGPTVEPFRPPKDNFAASQDVQTAARQPSIDPAISAKETPAPNNKVAIGSKAPGNAKSSSTSPRMAPSPEPLSQVDAAYPAWRVRTKAMLQKVASQLQAGESTHVAGDLKSLYDDLRKSLDEGVPHEIIASKYKPNEIEAGGNSWRTKNGLSPHPDGWNDTQAGVLKDLRDQIQTSPPGPLRDAAQAKFSEVMKLRARGEPDDLTLAKLNGSPQAPQKAGLSIDPTSWKPFENIIGWANGTPDNLYNWNIKTSKNVSKLDLLQLAVRGALRSLETGGSPFNAIREIGPEMGIKHLTDLEAAHELVMRFMPSVELPKAAFPSLDFIRELQDRVRSTGRIGATLSDPAMAKGFYQNKRTGAFSLDPIDGGPAGLLPGFDDAGAKSGAAYMVTNQGAANNILNRGKAAGNGVVATYRSSPETLLGSNGGKALRAEMKSAGLGWDDVRKILDKVRHDSPKSLPWDAIDKAKNTANLFDSDWSTFEDRVKLYKALLNGEHINGVHWREVIDNLTEPGAWGYSPKDMMSIHLLDHEVPLVIGTGSPLYDTGLFGHHGGFTLGNTSTSELFPFAFDRGGYRGAQYHALRTGHGETNPQFLDQIQSMRQAIEDGHDVNDFMGGYSRTGHVMGDARNGPRGGVSKTNMDYLRAFAEYLDRSPKHWRK